MAVKEMAISFEIGTVLSGSFAKSFTTVGSLVGEVNKRISELNKTRSELDKYKKLKIINQDIINKILYSNCELKN